MCTSDELASRNLVETVALADVGGVSCSYDDKRVWTLSTNKTCNSTQLLTQAGSASFLDTVPQECTVNSLKAHVKCCADAVLGQRAVEQTVV